MTDSMKTKWILGIPVLNNICTNIEQFVNRSSYVSEQNVELRDSRISRDDSDVEKISEWFLYNFQIAIVLCQLLSEFLVTIILIVITLMKFVLI